MENECRPRGNPKYLASLQLGSIVKSRGPLSWKELSMEACKAGIPSHVVGVALICAMDVGFITASLSHGGGSEDGDGVEAERRLLEVRRKAPSRKETLKTNRKGAKNDTNGQADEGS